MELLKQVLGIGIPLAIWVAFAIGAAALGRREVDKGPEAERGLAKRKE